MAKNEPNKPEDIKIEPANNTPTEQTAPVKEPLAADKQAEAPEKKAGRGGRPPKAEKADKEPKPEKAPKAEKSAKAPKAAKTKQAAGIGGAGGSVSAKATEKAQQETPPPAPEPEKPPEPREAPRSGEKEDNLNTHSLASLYVAFPPAEAWRLAERFEIHHTPKHASWLNMAEIEIGVMSRQCLNQRIPSKHKMASYVAAWTCFRNSKALTVNWQFTTADARIKLKHLYQKY